MSAGRPGLRVLVVDDSADDCALAIEALGSIVMEWARVQTRDELVRALAREWDVALVDWSLPGWGGQFALECLAAQERRPPAIVVSGGLPGPAEIARAMAAGASAFLEKSDRVELAAVVDRVLLEAGGSLLERTAAYLLASPELAATALDAVPMAVLAVSARGGLIRVANVEALRLTGYAHAELVGVPVEVLLPEVLRDRHARHRERYFDAPRERALGDGPPLVLCRKDRRRLAVDVMLRPVMAREGLLVLVVIRHAG